MLDLDFCLSFSPSPILEAVTYTKGIKRLSKAERTDILLPEVTKDILVGILLGDGHIFISPKMKKVKGCLYSSDLAYLYWCYIVLVVKLKILNLYSIL